MYDSFVVEAVVFRIDLAPVIDWLLRLRTRGCGLKDKRADTSQNKDELFHNFSEFGYWSEERGARKGRNQHSEGCDGMSTNYFVRNLISLRSVLSVAFLAADNTDAVIIYAGLLLLIIEDH